MRKLLVFAIWCMVALIGIMLVTFTPHSWQCNVQPPPRRSVARLLFSPETNNVISITSAGEVTVWGDGKQPLTVYKIKINERFPDQSPLQAQVSPDGSTIASVNSKGEVVLWETLSGTIKHILRGSTVIYVVVYSADGAKLSTANERGTISVWNLETGQVLYQMDAGSINQGRFSPDGTLLVTTNGDSTIQLYNADSGRLLRQFVVSDKTVNVATVSPDNQLVAVGMQEGTVLVRSIVGDSVNVTLPRIGDDIQSVMQMEFLPDSNHLLVRYFDGTIRLWDIRSAQMLYAVNTINYTYFVAAPDGKTFITPDRDTVHVWDAQSGALLHTLPHVHGNPEITELFKDIPYSQYPTAFFAYSGDSTRLLTIDYYDTAIWWDAQTGELIRPLCPLALDQRWIVVGVGLCASAVIAAGRFVWRMVKAH